MTKTHRRWHKLGVGVATGALGLTMLAIPPATADQTTNEEPTDLLGAEAAPLTIEVERVGATGSASGGIMAGLVDAELKDTRIIRAAGFALPTLNGPTAPGTVSASEPAGVPTGNGIEDLDQGVTFGTSESTIELTEDGTIQADTSLDELVIDHQAFDEDGLLGVLTDTDNIVHLTSASSAAQAGAAGLDAGFEVASLQLLGEEVPLTDGALAEPVELSSSHTIDDAWALVEAMDVAEDLADFGVGPDNLSGSGSATLYAEATSPATNGDDAAQAALEISLALEVDAGLSLSGSPAALLRNVELTTEGPQPLATITVAASSAAQDGSIEQGEPAEPTEPEEPIEPEEPSEEPSEPAEPEAPEADITGVPGVEPDRVILNPTADPATSQTVTWRTDASVTNGVVELRTGDSTEEVTAATGEPFTAENTVEGEYTSRSHTATLTELTPDTTYEYRVGDGEEHWSPWYEFTTAANSEEAFEFLYLGDVQNDITEHGAPAMRDAFANSDAEIVLHAGDQVNHAENDYEWAEWFAAEPEVFASMNHALTPGNHEYHSSRIAQQWHEGYTFPSNGPVATAEAGTCERIFEDHLAEVMQNTVYYTDYQGVRFIGLNANTAEGFAQLFPATETLAEADCADSGINPVEIWLDMQADWLTDVVDDAPGNWTVALHHQPLFSVSTGRNNQHLRDHWLEPIQEAGVDLVLAGHDHTYGRGYLLDDEIDAESGLYSGPTFAVSVIGPKMYEVADPSVWEGWGAQRVTALQDTQLYQRINVDDGTLSYESRKVGSGEVVDTFTLCTAADGTKYGANSAADLPEDCNTAKPAPTPTDPEPTDPEPTKPADQVGPSLTLSAHEVAQGETLTATVEGLEADQDVHLWIHSVPTSLGSAVANDDGTANFSDVLISEEIPVGEHTVHVKLADEESTDSSVAEATLTVTAAGSESTSTPTDPTPTDSASPADAASDTSDSEGWLAQTGVRTGLIVLVIAGLLAVAGGALLVMRRNRLSNND